MLIILTAPKICCLRCICRGAIPVTELASLSSILQTPKPQGPRVTHLCFLHSITIVLPPRRRSRKDCVMLVNARSRLLTIGTTDIWGQKSVCGGGRSRHYKMFCCIPGLYPLDASSSISPVLTIKMSPDIAKNPLGDRITLGWEPLVEMKQFKSSFEPKDCHCLVLFF